MNLPDPISTGIITATALQVAKQAQDFVAAVAGHAGESIGTILGNITKRRIENVEAVTGKAGFILLNIGVKPKEVPLNILHPILEGASLQEDTYLRDTWANLLANAADPRNQNPVQPVFKQMLSELSSREVRFLDQLFRDHPVHVPGGMPGWSLQGSYGTAFRIDDPDQRHLAVSLAIILRNQILGEKAITKPLDLGTAVSRVPRGSLPRQIPIQTQDMFYFTALGRAFVVACGPPTQLDSPADSASAST